MSSEDVLATFAISKRLEIFLIAARKEQTDQDDSLCEDYSANTQDFQPIKDLACKKDFDDKEDDFL